MGIRNWGILSWLLVAIAVAGCSVGGTSGGSPPPPTDSFSFTAPADSSQLAENQQQSITLTWTAGGDPVGNQSVTLTASQGTLSATGVTSGSSVTMSTGKDGTINVNWIATSGGSSTLTATATNPITKAPDTATLTVTFVGAPSKITATAPSPIAVTATSLVSAVVSDASGTPLSGQTVTFSLPSGGGSLSPTSAVTDSTGTATSTFTPDGTVSEVTVQAVQALLAPVTVTIQVGGPPQAATITFSKCPAAMPSGGSVTCTMTVTDPTGKPINNQTLTLSAALGVVTPITGASSYVTNASGVAQFVYCAATDASICSTTPSGTGTTVVGQETLTVTASVTGSSGSSTVTQTDKITVNPSAFSFTSPTASSQFKASIPTPVVLQWTSSGANVSGQPVTLTVTPAGNALSDGQGHIGSSLTETTTSGGTVSVNVIGILPASGSSNQVTIVATGADSVSSATLSGSLLLDVVGDPSTFDLQFPSSIPADGTGLVAATVKDSLGNVLTGIPAKFTRSSGNGTLSPSTNGGTVANSTSDSSGVARALYTASGSDVAGSTINIKVDVASLAQQTATFTVGSAPPPTDSFAFTSPANNSQVAESHSQTIALLWTSNGTPVANQPVTLSASSGVLFGGSSSGSSVVVQTANDGTLSASWIGSTGGTATVTATAVNPTSGSTDTATLSLVFVGPPTTLTVSATSPVRLPGGESVVSAVLTDATPTPLSGLTVNFTVPTGGGTLTASSVVTDSSGTARTVLTPDGSVSSVTVQAKQSQLAPQFAIVQVQQSGPPPGSLTFTGCPSAMPEGGLVSCSVTLTDINAAPIAGTVLSLTPALGSVAPVTTYVTDGSGTVHFTYCSASATAFCSSSPSGSAVSGAEVITASANVSTGNGSQAVSQTQDITVNPTIFGFTSPSKNSQVTATVPAPMVFQWSSGATAVAGQSVQLQVSPSGNNLIDGVGTIAPSLTETTAGDGTIDVSLRAVQPPNGQSNQVTVMATSTDTASSAQMFSSLPLFVVGSPVTPFTLTYDNSIPVGATSLLTVTLKDSQNRALSGLSVTFAITAGNGPLSPSSNGGQTSVVTTNSNGQASALYSASTDAAGATVTISVTVGALPVQTATISITH